MLQEIQAGSVVLSVLFVVWRILRIEGRMDEKFKDYRDVCNLRHNPVEKDLNELKLNMRELRKDVTALMVSVGSLK